jgi:hypothetical protein
MCRTNFELVINPITGACLIVNRHPVKTTDNVVQLRTDGHEFLDVYNKMTIEAGQ